MYAPLRFLCFMHILMCIGQTAHLNSALLFSPSQSKRDLAMFTEVAREPRGMEWLWHPQILHVYNLLMKNCQINSTTREAAAGAVQNITAGDKRVSTFSSTFSLKCSL